MRFIGINGDIHNKDISSYRRSVGDNSKSTGQRTLAEILEIIWPNICIYEEMPCFGTQLKIDLYIPSLGIAFEFDGEQHSKYTPFFHGSRYNYIRAKNRDESKEQWCKNNNITLIRVIKEELDIDKIREKVNGTD